MIQKDQEVAKRLGVLTYLLTFKRLGGMTGKDGAEVQMRYSYTRAKAQYARGGFVERDGVCSSV